MSECLSRRLRETRKRLGLTQEDVAERLGQAQSWISKCERGERRLDVIEVRAFCKAMGVEFVGLVAEFDREADRRKKR